MWLAVISALVCFAVSVILFTPPLRSFPFYQAIALFFLFEGAWCLFNSVILEVWPQQTFMIFIQYIGIILFAGYLFYKMFIYYLKNSKNEETSDEMKDKE